MNPRNYRISFKLMIFFLIFSLGGSRRFSSMKSRVRSGFHSASFELLSTSQSNPPGFQNAVIANLVPDATDLKLIDIQVSKEVSQAYSSPGQYLQIKINDQKPGFYAIASPPDGRDIITLLVKETENNKWLTTAKPGANIDITLPLGKGFQIDEYLNSYRFDFPTSNIYLLATGSGIAPIAAAIESEVLGLNTAPKNSLHKRTGILYVVSLLNQNFF